MPMGLLCVATPVSHAGYQVKIIDQRVEPNWNELLRRELEQDPLCVGISSSTGPQLRYALEVSEIAREYGNVPVVWGGVHPSLLPEQTLRDDRVDIVVQGEGEETFLELVQALEGKRPLSTVKGIWHKDKARITHTGIRPFMDLNQLPPLSYHLIEPRKYLRTVFGAERLSFFTDRGCPYQCAFCFNTAFNRRTWRSMEPERVVQRIRDFVRRYQLKGLAFIDSNFFAEIDRGRSILEGIIREDLNIVISRINIRADTLLKMSEEDFALLERAGCRCLCVGVESGSERIRAMLRKPINVPMLLEMNRGLKRLAIVPLYFFMMGFPSETKEDLTESVSLILRLLDDNPNAVKSLNIYTPFPGTELFDIAVTHGLSVPQSIEEWIPFNYRNITQNAPWISKEMRKLIEMIDFCSFFIGEKSFLRPFKKTHPFAVLLSNLYAPLAKKRVENFFCQFPVEIKIAKLLRLFARQD
jgi:radical SAM superfamily enzyme YgiQ (UPF0313 family)